MANILVIGYGDIGAALAKELMSSGHTVTGLRRTDIAEKSKASFIKADVSDINSLKNHSFNFDQVVYILSPSGGGLAEYEKVFDHGVRNVLELFKEQCPQVAITFVSSTRVYGQDKGEWVNEDSVTDPKDERGRLLLGAEKAFLAFNKKTTVVRFSGIYGRSNYFLNQIKSGVGIQKGPPYYTNRIHRDDCVGALIFIVNKKSDDVQMVGVYIASDSDPAAKWDVATYLAGSVNTQQPEAIVLELNVSQNKRIENRRLIEAGYKFKYPSYKQGYGVVNGK